MPGKLVHVVAILSFQSGDYLQDDSHAQCGLSKLEENGRKKQTVRYSQRYAC